jgi:type I restriction-modification system DNA methylase subunit
MSLFNKKTISRAIAPAILGTDAPDAAKLGLLRQWAATIKSGEIETQKETALHGNFKSKIIVEVLGYRDFNDSGAWTVDVEAQIGAGSVDLAFGHFTADTRNIIAPFELKGAKTKNLDAIMPGRAKSPVDQAWEYATNNVGTKWVLVSNYLKIRLYSYGEGRQAYETFDLRRLHEPEEYARAQLLLSAENLLGGRTAELLEESRRENKDITNRLYADYKTLRSDLIGEVRREQPDMDPLAAIRTGQTILDRILFIAFAEDTSLLPPKSIEKAYEHADPYHPRPVWETFQSLFNAIDTGLPKALNIPRYNGGLFAPDETINALKIPDHICEGFKRLSEYDFASEISVTVLGHIFEQSIADVEQLQAEARGDAPPEKKASGTSGRRKRDGVVYTPNYIARFIVEQTLGTHAREIFTRLLTEHASKNASADDDPIKWKSAAAERGAWTAYRDALAKLRIVDPACGSGVFLVMAFDWLKAELARVNEKLVELTGVGALLDPDSEILTHNLFGVDVNEESVEIAKLSLWIKTARHGKVLDSLDDNFCVGDSLIEDSSYGFVWKEAFKDIFAEGGFDIVLGNPPYVRQELLKDLKPSLQGRFEVYHGVVDLYAYFFERGLRILKPGGRMGYISSSTFFKTGSGGPLRDYLRNKATLETVVDFGDHQIFEGVTTYPAILTMRNDAPSERHEIAFWKIKDLPKDNFDAAYRDHAEPYPQSALASGSWELENPALRNLRNKIVAGKPTLKAVYGSPLYGIKTGRNEAFVIDRKTRDALIAEDPKSAEILKPFLEGRDIRRLRAEPRDIWLIFTRQGVDLERYPAIASYLANFRALLEPKPKNWKPTKEMPTWLGRKAGPYKWYEIQDTVDYHQKFDGQKIVYAHFLNNPMYLLDSSGIYANNKAYIVPNAGYFELGLFISKALWLVFTGLTTMVRGGFYEATTQNIETLPIPPATDAQKAELAALAESAQAAAEERYRLQQDITRRIPDLAPSGHPAKLTERLKAWWDLPDFAAFRAEVKKAFKADIPLKERNEWENWISETRQQIHALTAKITALEAEINTRVYALFGLTPDEITLLESSL